MWLGPQYRPLTLRPSGRPGIFWRKEWSPSRDQSGTTQLVIVGVCAKYNTRKISFSLFDVSMDFEKFPYLIAKSRIQLDFTDSCWKKKKNPIQGPETLPTGFVCGLLDDVSDVRPQLLPQIPFTHTLTLTLLCDINYSSNFFITRQTWLRSASLSNVK